MTGTPAEAADLLTLDADELAVGLRVLADLVEAGLPLTQALAAFREVATPRWSAAATRMQSSVREGRGLARALEECGLAIPPLVTGLVRAGEAGSGVELALRRAAEYAESTAATRDAIRSALAYPAVIAIAGCGALALMVGVVMPRFASVLDGLGQSLPPFTRAVILVADVGRQLAVPGVIGAGVAIAIGHEAVSRPSGRRWFHRLLLSVPGVGSVRHAAGTARLAAALAALLESGVPLRRGLRDAGPTVGDAELLGRLDDARRRIDSGERLGQAFASARVVTPLAARLVAAGEQSGRLIGMLTFAARLEQNRAERIVRTSVRLLEPLLILLFAGVVAAVAAAMLQAVYAVRPS